MPSNPASGNRLSPAILQPGAAQDWKIWVFFFNCPDESLLEESLNTSKGIKWEREVLLFPSFLFPRQVRSAFNPKKKNQKKKKFNFAISELCFGFVIPKKKKKNDI